MESILSLIVYIVREVKLCRIVAAICSKFITYNSISF